MHDQYGSPCLSGEEKSAMAVLQQRLRAIYHGRLCSEEYLAHVSVGYHFAGNGFPAHLFIRMMPPTISRNNLCAHDQNVALPEKIVGGLESMLGDDCCVGKGNEYIKINGRFADVSATLSKALEQMEQINAARPVRPEQRHPKSTPPGTRKPLLCLPVGTAHRQPTASGNSPAR